MLGYVPDAHWNLGCLILYCNIFSDIEQVQFNVTNYYYYYYSLCGLAADDLSPLLTHKGYFS